MGLKNYLKDPGWKPGIYELKNYEQYAAIPALRSSELKWLRKSPAHYRAAVLNPKPVSPQLERTFAKGKAFDVLTLHGQDRFQNLVTIEPDLDRRTKKYKEWKMANSNADCILSAEEKEKIIHMRQSAGQKSQFSKIFDGNGFAHRVIVWKDSRTGIWCKAEIDWICEDGTVVDLKSTSDAGFWFFNRNARRLGYINQGMFYLDGLMQITGVMHDKFLLAAVEVEPPWESHVFRVSHDQLDRAQMENEERMSALKQCFETDSWPGYPDMIMDLDSGQYDYDEYYDDEIMEEMEYGI